MLKLHALLVQSMPTESDIVRRKKPLKAVPPPTANGKTHTPLPGHCRTVRLLDPGPYVDRKRVFDRVAAVLILLVSSPVILFALLLVKLTSRGPAIYSQTRLGLRGRPFTMYKIRTMHQDSERDSGARWATARDPRITPVGRILRRMHVDELLQLWNAIRGDMSLVGPRPERPEFVPTLAAKLPLYRDRLLVRPGMTGLAQVQLPADTDLASVRRKLAYDLYYVEHVGPALDFKVLLATGLYLLCIPFTFWQRLLGVPSGRPVEVAYQLLAAQANAAAHAERK